MSSINAVNRLRGSAMRRSRESEVNIHAGFKVAEPLLAIAVKTTNVRTGDISCGT